MKKIGALIIIILLMNFNIGNDIYFSNQEELKNETIDSSLQNDSSPYYKITNLSETLIENIYSQQQIPNITETIYENEQFVNNKIEKSSFDEEDEIKKEEIIKSENEKRIVIRSKNHIETPIRVYTTLPKPARKESIRIIWENENVDVTNSSELIYEEVEEGLVKSISWVVPHLSTQYYKIIIELSGNDSLENEIYIKVNSPQNGSVVENPIFFNVSINYTNISNVDCFLKINDEEYVKNFGLGSAVFTPINLSSGLKNWTIECRDSYNTSIIKRTAGHFMIVERPFEISGIESFYFLNSTIYGIINSPNNKTSIEVFSPNGSRVYYQNTTNGPFNITDLLDRVGEYKIVFTNNYFEVPRTTNQSFKVGLISAKFRQSEIALGEEAIIELNIDPQGFSGNYIIMADSEYVEFGSFSNILNKEIKFKPNEEKTYILTISGHINGKQYSIQSQNSLKINSLGDKTKPEITIIFPRNNEIINSSEIEFKYKASDNVALKNCTISIYNTSRGISDKLIFPIKAEDKNIATKTNPKNNEEIVVKVLNFSSGDYYFEVECFDNSSNYDWDLNSFSVRLSNETILTTTSTAESYEKEELVKKLIDIINEFIEEESKMKPEEKEIANILGITERNKASKKKLIQYDQDLKYNMKFMNEEKKRERINQIYEDIEKISKEIVKSISIKDRREYSKSSPTNSIEEILKEYLNELNTKISKSNFRKLTVLNEKIQKRINVNVLIRKVEIENYDSKSTIYVIIKNIELEKDSSTKEFLEYLPEKMASKSPIFLNDIQNVSEKIKKFHYNDLNEKKLIYYFNEEIHFSDIEESDTILLSEDYDGVKYGITGFVVAGFDYGINYWWIILLILFISYLLAMIMFQRIRIEMWKRKEPNVSKMINLISQTRSAVFENDLARAHDKYNQMKELYKVLPVKTKKYFFEEIRKIRNSINKKDIINLLKEYEKAKKESRKEDAWLIYQKISEIYKVLPKKYQEKVYQRVVKNNI